MAGLGLEQAAGIDLGVAEVVEHRRKGGPSFLAGSRTPALHEGLESLERLLVIPDGLALGTGLGRDPCQTERGVRQSAAGLGVRAVRAGLGLLAELLVEGPR